MNLIDINMFDEDEKILLNHIGADTNKEMVMEQLKVNLVCAFDEMKEAVVSLLNKIEKMSEGEWQEVQKYIPLDVSIDEEDITI